MRHILNSCPTMLWHQDANFSETAYTAVKVNVDKSMKNMSALNVGEKWNPLSNREISGRNIYIAFASGKNIY